MRQTLRGALLAIGLTLVACGAPREGELARPVLLWTAPPEPAPTLAREALAPEFLPALEALQQAVQAGDDPTALAILRRLLARRPTGPTLELARSFERVLDGRQVVRDLVLRLEVCEERTTPGRYALELVLTQEGSKPLILRPGPARLVQRMVAVEEDGGERRGASGRSVPVPAAVVVEPGVETRLDLGFETIPDVFGALAVRCRWELRFLSGEVLVEGRALPAMRLEAAPLSRVLLASHLPSGPVAHDELARYAREGRVRRAAALERAVRTPPSAYRAALDGLAREVQILNLIALEELIPALRWLADESGPGGDPEAWQRWLQARARGLGSPASALDMPAARR